MQSVVADGRGSLWVLDAAAPAVDGLVPGGPKLVRIDLATDRVAQVIHFDQKVAIPGSYLNVRFSKDGKFAFITDAGQRGALVVVELASGQARRVQDPRLRWPDTFSQGLTAAFTSPARASRIRPSSTAMRRWRCPPSCGG